jgi:diadenosine tetraphosphate (Ap4A) HIT family hydrolase/GNAT superfamily N-acetyltransferase
MLIRWVTEKDLPEWYALAAQVSETFQHPGNMGSDPEFELYAQSKASKYEALTAVDYISGNNMGFIGFSRVNNRISWFAVFEACRNKSVGGRLLKTALRQLDTTREISVTTFCGDYPPGAPARAVYAKFGFADSELVRHNGLPRSLMIRPASDEKRGWSFHYRYPEFIKATESTHCPVCSHNPAPDEQVDIAYDNNVYICGEYPGQGRLFGKLYVMPQKHFVHFEDMPADEMAGFMREVQQVGAALRKITGAVKIYYEMHANSGAHLHIHLFPRYLDDDYPSAPIDYRITEPAPYENYEEFLWFIDQIRTELRS